MPFGPSSPLTPLSPLGSAGPVIPVFPDFPGGPMGPGEPFFPFGPLLPRGPFAPVVPESPGGPPGQTFSLDLQYQEPILFKLSHDFSSHVMHSWIGKFSQITPALYELHWLPVSLRIDYKILLLTFKCIYGLAPTYLSDLISIKSNSLYNLRSTGKLLLDHPKGKMLTTLGARSFSAAAPKL